MQWERIDYDRDSMQSYPELLILRFSSFNQSSVLEALNYLKLMPPPRLGSICKCNFRSLRLSGHYGQQVTTLAPF
jgi:hypothetical protein